MDPGGRHLKRRIPACLTLVSLVLAAGVVGLWLRSLWWATDSWAYDSCRVTVSSVGGAVHVFRSQIELPPTLSPPDGYSWLALARSRHRPPGCCKACGYDLRAINPRNGCPECGEPIPGTGPATVERDAQSTGARPDDERGPRRG